MDQYPSDYNESFDYGIYLDAAPNSAYVRGYSEDTRPEVMDDCKACAGFYDKYYDKCDHSRNQPYPMGKLNPGCKPKPKPKPQQMPYPQQMMRPKQQMPYPQQPMQMPYPQPRPFGGIRREGWETRPESHVPNVTKSNFTNFTDNNTIIIILLAFIVVILLMNTTRPSGGTPAPFVAKGGVWIPIKG